MNKPKFIFSILILVTLVSCGENKKTVQYLGEDISDQASIWRDAKDKSVSLEIKLNEPWQLYAGPSVDKINLDKPVANDDKAGVYSIESDPTRRAYFLLVTPTAQTILSERLLPLEGAYNFRDLGGIKTKNGKHVRWNKVFRAGDLAGLTPADLSYLQHLPLTTVVDFRTNEEVVNAPDQLPSLTKSYHYGIAPGNLGITSISDMVDLKREEINKKMIEMNETLVSDSTIIEQYRKYFELLQDEKNTPLMFHCSAGKDRTGMAAALFLSALGVDEETIMSNYLLSNVYLGDKYAGFLADYPTLEGLFVVRPEFIQAGLNRIKADHGSIDHYLTQVLNVDLKKIQAIYLE